MPAICASSGSVGSGEIAAGAWKCAPPPPADARAPGCLTTARLPHMYRWATDADANALAWTFEAEGDAPTMWERATAAIDGIIARE